MGEVHFMISEAAKRVEVETHVLRYWEEELELPIGRTEMGHRYYTEENIQLFNCIKELKEQSMQLKELKVLIPDILKTKAQIKAQKAEKEVLKQAASKLNEKAEQTAAKEVEETKAPKEASKVKSEVKAEANAEMKSEVKAGAASEAKPEVKKSEVKSSEIKKSEESKELPSEGTALTKAAPEVIVNDKLGQVQALIGEVVQQVVSKNNKVLEKSVSTTVSEKVLKEMNYLMEAKERQEEERYKKLDYLIRQQQTNRKEAARMTPGKRLRKLLGDV